MNKELVWHTEKRRISELIPYSKNPRVLTKKTKKELMESLRTFNLMSIPVINTDNTIISGHQRIAILKELGRENDVIDVRVPSRKLTAREFKEANIRENKNIGDWDYQLLRDFDYDLLRKIGFSAEELDKIFHKVEEDNYQIDESIKPKTKAGDIYELNAHRLICGDAGDPQVYKKLLQNQHANLIVTDPPYNVGYSYDWRSPLHKGKKVPHNFFSDKKSVSEYSQLICDAFKNAYDITTEDANYYCWFAFKNICIVLDSILKAGWNFSQVLVWIKNYPVLSPGQDFHRITEHCLHGWKKGEKHFYNKVGDLTDVLNKQELEQILDVILESRDNISEYLHPTQKPVRLSEKLIIKSSRINDIVLDMFLGSGSTLIACEQLKRRCYGIELDPLYCDVIIDRYERFCSSRNIKCSIKKVNH